MFDSLITILLILLVVANLFLLGVLAYSRKGKKDATTKIGLGFMSMVIVCNIIFSVGGYFLW